MSRGNSRAVCGGRDDAHVPSCVIHFLLYWWDLNTHIPLSFSRLSPLWRQIAGAAVGTLVALVLYGVYDLASPSLLALLPGVSTKAEYSEERRDLRQQQIADTAKEIMSGDVQEQE